MCSVNRDCPSVEQCSTTDKHTYTRLLNGIIPVGYRAWH